MKYFASNLTKSIFKGALNIAFIGASILSPFASVQPTAVFAQTTEDSVDLSSVSTTTDSLGSDNVNTVNVQSVEGVEATDVTSDTVSSESSETTSPAPIMLAAAAAATATTTATVGQVYSFTTAGTKTWTVPSNVKTIKVTVWGAGGAGGNGTYVSGVAKAGQGGGAGGYASTASITVTANSSHTVTVGAGGSSGGTRNGGSSSFDSSVVATGGVGGANWNEIPDNGTLVDTKCFFEGTWTYNDQGGGNDFGVTCRSGKITAFCNMTGEAAGYARGLHAGDYVCEHGSTPTIGMKCDYDGTWTYNDQGGGNDFAVTCRNSKVTGWCSSVSTPRGFASGVYTCEGGQPITSSAPYCNFNGSWSYNDDGGGNDFALTCRNNKVTGWCDATPYIDRGEHVGSYSCEVDNPAVTSGSPIKITPERPLPLSFIEKVGNAIVGFIKPTIAYAASVFNGQGGTGTAGGTKHNGGTASGITNQVGGSLASNGGSAYSGGAGGYRGRLGRDGQGNCSGTVLSGDGKTYACTDTLARAQDGANPGAGGGGSDTGLGGKGGTGKVVIQVVSLVPAVNQAPSAPSVKGPTTGTTTVSYSFTASNSVDPDGDKIQYGFDWNNDGTIDDYTALIASGGSASLSHVWTTSGTYTFKVFAKDSLGHTSAGASYTITIKTQSVPVVNKAPVLSADGPSSGFTSTPYTFSGMAVDPEGDTVAYVFDWDGDGKNISTLGLSTSGVSGQSSHSWSTPGTYNVKIYAKDKNGNISNAIIKPIQISAAPIPNLAPSAPIITGSTTVSVNTPTLFAASSTDPEGDSISYAFDWDGNGTEVQSTGYVASGVLAKLSHTWNATGTVIFKVTASDSNGNISSSTAQTIQVVDVPTTPVNGAPNVPSVSGNSVGTTTEEYSFTATSVDPEGDDVQYGFDWDNNGTIDDLTSFASSSNPLALTHTWNTAGTYTFAVYALDTHGNKSAPKLFTITINDQSTGGGGGGNSAPTVPVVQAPSVATTTATVSLSVTSTDPDGDNIQYGFDWNGDGVIDEFSSFVSPGASFDMSHIWNATGTTAYNVYAKDSHGNVSAPSLQTIDIIDLINDVPPTITLPIAGPSAGVFNTSYTFFVTGTDPDVGDTISYGFDWNNNGIIETNLGESWSNPVASGVTVQGSNSWGTSGNKIFRIIARDSKGAESFATSSINIVGGPSNINFTLSTTTDLTTSESGATAVFTVVLASAPNTTVTLPIVSSDLTEGTTSVSELDFTPLNWNIPQTVTITGIDDTELDGNVAYHVTVGPSVSTDINWNNINSQTVSVLNYDNEQPAPTVTKTSTGGGGGGGSSGSCYGYNCSVPVVTTEATTSPVVPHDIMVTIDQVASAPALPIPTAHAYCKSGEFITTYMRKGVDNNPDEVRKLQTFLNTYDNAGLAVNGVFDGATEDAVKVFQTKHSANVLSPWGVTAPTGIVYITTTNEINRVYCGDNPDYNGTKNVLYPPTTSPSDFNGLIGQATSTNNVASNIAAVGGAVSPGVLGFIKDIPWYQILLILLLLIGTGFTIQGMIIKDIGSEGVLRTLLKGAAIGAVASVLNVLNTLSFMLNPLWLDQKLGVSLSWVLGLDILNGILVIIVCLIALFSLYGKISKVSTAK